MKKELEVRTKRFALSVIRLLGKLARGKVSDVIGYQLLKSGTSIGANYREAKGIADSEMRIAEFRSTQKATIFGTSLFPFRIPHFAFRNSHFRNPK
jgi:hypothetical protein